MGAKLLADELAAVAAGVRDGKVSARVDSLTRGAAAQTIVCDNATGTAGDKLFITVPGRARYAFTAVTGAAVAANGEYSIDTSDTAMASSLVLAINAVAGIKHILTATSSTDTVTVTAQLPGTWAHTITLLKSVTQAGTLTLGGATLTGGDDIFTKPQITITFGSADIVANDTISIGSIEYTWVASASTANEITLSTTPATAAANFNTKINADTRWAGLITSSVVTETVTLTWEGDPRVGQHILMTIAETNSGSVVLNGTVLITNAESFTLGTTATGSSTTRVYGRGAA
jgi:hypothetical protein